MMIRMEVMFGFNNINFFLLRLIFRLLVIVSSNVFLGDLGNYFVVDKLF